MEASKVTIGGKAARNITLGGATLWEGGKYEALEYIGSTGSQYIATGYMFNLNTVIDEALQISSRKDTGFALHGVYCRSLWGFADSLYSEAYSPNNEKPANFTAFGNTIRMAWTPEMWYQIHKENGFHSVNEESITFYPLTTLQSPSSLNLFKSPWDSGTYFRLGRFTISEFSSALHDFLPVRRISDGTLGMYDTVTKTFFTNQGTGSFTAGPATGERL